MQKIISSGNELLDARTILTENLHLEPGKVVGDLGCGGAGHFTLAAARLVGDQGQIYAVDVLKTVLSSVESKARLQRLYNVKPIWSNLEVVGATSIPEKSLDYAFINNVLFQSHKRAEILHEAVRLLKSQGKLMIIDWDRGHAAMGPADEDKVDPDAIRQIATDLGLAEIDNFKAGQYHFGMVFMKPS